MALFAQPIKPFMIKCATKSMLPTERMIFVAPIPAKSPLEFSSSDAAVAQVIEKI